MQCNANQSKTMLTSAMWITKQRNCTCNGKQSGGIQCNTMHDKTKDRESPRRPRTQRSQGRAALGRAQEDPKGSPRQGQRVQEHPMSSPRNPQKGAQAWPQESSKQAPERSTGGRQEAPHESPRMTPEREGPKKCLLSPKRKPQRAYEGPQEWRSEQPHPLRRSQLH